MIGLKKVDRIEEKKNKLKIYFYEVVMWILEKNTNSRKRFIIQNGFIFLQILSFSFHPIVRIHKNSKLLYQNSSHSIPQYLIIYLKTQNIQKQALNE
jgi:hypothetical protein